MMADVRVPGSVMFEHGIENGEQFAHAGNQGHFLGLAGGAEPPIETPNHGIEAGHDDRCHVECCPRLGTPAPEMGK